MASGRRGSAAGAGTGPEHGVGCGTTVVVPPLAWWDAGRCMVHGKFDATVFGGVPGGMDFVVVLWGMWQEGMGLRVSAGLTMFCHYCTRFQVGVTKPCCPPPPLRPPFIFHVEKLLR